MKTFHSSMRLDDYWLKNEDGSGYWDLQAIRDDYRLVCKERAITIATVAATAGTSVGHSLVPSPQTSALIAGSPVAFSHEVLDLDEPSLKRVRTDADEHGHASKQSLQHGVDVCSQRLECGTQKTQCVAPEHSCERDGAACRICLEESPITEFINPCSCRGSLLYVHPSCLLKSFQRCGEWTSLSCRVCGQKYNGHTCVELGTFALHAMQALHGKEHRRVAVALANLGNAHLSVGSVEEARNMLELALRIKEREYGSEHKHVAITLSNLGNVYCALGLFPLAKEVLERAIAIQEREYGDRHCHVASVLVNLGNLHTQCRDFLNAKAVLERALDIEESEYGSVHREVATTLVSLSCVYGFLGDAPRRQQSITRALRIDMAVLGADHLESQLTRYHYAVVLGEIGQIDEALRVLEEARDVLERSSVANTSLAGRIRELFDQWRDGNKCNVALKKGSSEEKWKP